MESEPGADLREPRLKLSQKQRELSTPALVRKALRSALVLVCMHVLVTMNKSNRAAAWGSWPLTRGKGLVRGGSGGASRPAVSVEVYPPAQPTYIDPKKIPCAWLLTPYEQVYLCLKAVPVLRAYLSLLPHPLCSFGLHTDSLPAPPK